MKIHKYGHACLSIEKDGVRIIVDPGSWNPVPDATGVSAILITHEHGDHYDPAQVKAIQAANPDATVITHAAVGEKLAADGIEEVVIVEPGNPITVNSPRTEAPERPTTRSAAAIASANSSCM